MTLIQLLACLPACLHSALFWKNNYFITFHLLKLYLDPTGCNRPFSLKLAGQLALLSWAKSYCLYPVFCLKDNVAAFWVLKKELCVHQLPCLGVFQISAGLMKNILSVHMPGRMHVIALNLQALESFTPRQVIQGCCGKKVCCMCHRPALLGCKEQSSGDSHAHRPVISEKWKVRLNHIEVPRHPAKKIFQIGK